MKLDCIYVLFDCFELVYIGQTRNLNSRIPTHFNKTWTRIRWIPCERDKMFYWEKRLIRYFKPKYNRQFLPSGKPIKGMQTLKLEETLLTDLKSEAVTFNTPFNRYVETLLSNHPYRLSKKKKIKK